VMGGALVYRGARATARAIRSVRAT
jgi:hypothetical protein